MCSTDMYRRSTKVENMKDGPRWKTTEGEKIKNTNSIGHELTPEEKEKQDRIAKQRENEF